MSPAGIAARLQQYAVLSQRYSSGLPRVHRTSLQFARAPQPEPRVQAPKPLLSPSAVPQETIARVCTDVVTGRAAFGELNTTRSPRRKTSATPQHSTSKPVGDINLPPGWRNIPPSTTDEPSFLEQHLRILRGEPPCETQLRKPTYDTSNEQYYRLDTSKSSSTKTQRRLPPVTPTTTQTATSKKLTSHASDATDSSIEPIATPVQIFRVSQWAEEQRKIVCARIPTPQQDIFTRADTTAGTKSHSSTLATTEGYVWVDSRGPSPATVFFPRETLKSNIPHDQPDLFCDALCYMEQHRPKFVVPLKTANLQIPFLKSRSSIRLTGPYGTLVDEYLLALADDMRQAGVRDINDFPPVKPQHGIRGAFTLQDPVLHILALKFPDPDTTPWCVKNLCPSLVCTMKHKELGSLEERMVLAINYANSAVHFLTTLRDTNTPQKTNRFKMRAGQIVGKSHHALHAIYAGIVAVRRRDVIDPILSVKQQLSILQRPVSGTATLVDEQ